MWLNVWLHWRWSVIKTESPPTAVLNKSTEVRMQFPLLYMQKLCCNSCWENSKGILVWLSLALVLYMEHEIHSKSIHVKSTCEELLSCSLLLPVVSKVTIGTFFFFSIARVRDFEQPAPDFGLKHLLPAVATQYFQISYLLLSTFQWWCHQGFTRPSFSSQCMSFYADSSKITKGTSLMFAYIQDCQLTCHQSVVWSTTAPVVSSTC